MPLLLQPSQSRHLLRTFARRSTHSRTSNYNGWWSLILDQPAQVIYSDSFQQRKPIAVPIVDDLPPPVKVEEKPKEIVVLQGKRIELPQKPPAPEDCCMSGCAYW
ncbi:hypothetical protein BJV82DRAFT_515368 [Fennellomyces sp. T-0311]|nr:hypothetical protein BJV82DRAFT_515368 [Fennellomyces sp. T-0311]